MAYNDLHSQGNAQHDDDEMRAAEEYALTEANKESSRHSRLSEAPEDVTQPERLEKTERFMRETPMVAPSPGFAARVMATIAALPLPEVARRHLSIGLAMGLFAVALIVMPVLAVAFVLLLVTAINPAVWATVLSSGIDVANYLGGLLLDMGDGLESLVSGTPVLPAVVGIIVPLLVLWGWVLWQLLGKGRAFTTRQKP